MVEESLLTISLLLTIKHYTSCPHTPEQNGLAKRKHRYLVELGLSMMFEAKLPQTLWVEAFFTANFLTNLLHTTALGTTTSPYENLNGIAPEYSALRVMGCACYPYLLIINSILRVGCVSSWVTQRSRRDIAVFTLQQAEFISVDTFSSTR